MSRREKTSDPDARHMVDFHGVLSRSETTKLGDKKVSQYLAFDTPADPNVNPKVRLTVALSDLALSSKKKKNLVIFYKVKTTAPKNYRVTNKQGALSIEEPAKTLEIKWQHMNEQSIKRDNSDDQFMVQYACYAPGLDAYKKIQAQGIDAEKEVISQRFKPKAGEKVSSVKTEAKKFKVTSLRDGEQATAWEVNRAVLFKAQGGDHSTDSASGPAVPMLTIFTALLVLGTFVAGYVFERQVFEMDKDEFLSVWFIPSSAAVVLCLLVDIIVSRMKSS